MSCCSFFFNDTAPTEIYTLSLHDALPIYSGRHLLSWRKSRRKCFGHYGAARAAVWSDAGIEPDDVERRRNGRRDRKSTRLNSSHVEISYAVFCLKKKKRNRPLKDNIHTHA